MKIPQNSLVCFALVLCFGTTALSASSCAAVGHSSHALALSGAASGEALSAVGASAQGSLQIASGVLAVPVMLSGNALGGSGALIAAVGASAAEAGAAIKEDGKELWDFATGDPAKRPALNRQRAVPPVRLSPSKPNDPSPAEAMNRKL